MEHVMIDLETLDTAATSVILSIGAVKFDPNGQPLGDRFYVTCDIQDQVKLGRTINANTLKWWMQQGEAAKRVFAEDAVGLRIALQQLQQFFDHEDYKVWGNGAAFDNAILHNAFQRVGMKMPWSHRNDRCFRTLRALNPLVKPESFFGVEHNALDDAINQALHAQLLLGGGQGIDNDDLDGVAGLLEDSGLVQPQEDHG